MPGRPADLNDPFSGTPYRVRRRLGAGGMGEVFEVEHDVVGRLLVAKILRLELSNDPGTVDRMRVEAQALARLDHPNIVSVSDFRTTEDGRPFFVMERLEGSTVGQEFRRRGAFAVQEAISIVRQVLNALSAAHGLGLVHRDIKLDNVFLHSDPRGGRVVKVLDFGVAKIIGGQGRAPAPPALPTAEGVIVGTPRYVSPEQVRGKGVDQRADIYGAGLMLYLLVAGRGPFDHVEGRKDLLLAHLSEEPEPPSKYAKQAIPSELDAAILRAIRKSPDDRYQSADRFEAALASIASRRAAPIGWLRTELSPSPGPARATVPTDTVRTGAPEFLETTNDLRDARVPTPTEVVSAPEPARTPEISTRTAQGEPAPEAPAPTPMAQEPPRRAEGLPHVALVAGVAAAMTTSLTGVLFIEAPSGGAVAGLVAASLVAASIAVVGATRIAR